MTNAGGTLLFSIIKGYQKKYGMRHSKRSNQGPDPVVQSSDNTIQRLNRHPADKWSCSQSALDCPQGFYNLWTTGARCNPIFCPISAETTQIDMVGRSVPIPIPNKIAPFQLPKKQLQRQKDNEKLRTTDRQPYSVLRIKSTSDISSQSLPSLLNDNEYFDTQKSFVGWPWIATADTLASFSKSICKNWLASWISGIHAPLPWRRAWAGSWALSRIDEAVMAASWIQKVCMPSELLQVDPMVENKRLFQSP